MRLFGLYKEDLVTLASCVIVCGLVGVAGSLFTLSEIPSWYATLVKPPFTPPNWVFGPVWATLYVLMGFSLFILWHCKKTLHLNEGSVKHKSWHVERKGIEPVNFALAFFGVQLLFNALWPILFFGLHAPLLAFFEIIFLWVSIASCIMLFWKFSKTASLLFVPYLAWVTLAAALNYYIWILN